MTTWIAAIALLSAGFGLLYAWKLQQELGVVTRRLDRYNKALFDASDDLRRLRQELAETSAQLRVELKQQAGRAHFAPAMTVREAQLLHPQADQVMAGLHLGGCSSCAVEPDSTLATACAEQGVDLDQLLHNLNLLVSTTNGHTNGSSQPVKLPNMELDF